MATVPTIFHELTHDQAHGPRSGKLAYYELSWLHKPFLDGTRVPLRGHPGEIEAIRKEIALRFAGIVKDPVILLQQQKQYISTGIENLDKLLGGGLYACRFYEICGNSSAGKTQLCITLAANIALNSSADIHYIDTKKDFSATRLQNILEAKNKPDEVGAASGITALLLMTRISIAVLLN
ncbi:Similar to RAD51D: DNA repair protein RAD51 homolog 4 (Homo sapiens) [Cotesia congregata]|uniref:Similar to RAD51D: DNA repair protein RAD51 homolog 4 (Homo sapiens) n=1 Tax=Cotesia congregata TaxID=51543 RepID=A0A8J2MKL6_COTCN|nr:Similar to RAD51D: DNA repair protein RAD51 homolog 4 (Homo sapiens) [Cotesia congregata]